MNGLIFDYTGNILVDFFHFVEVFLKLRIFVGVEFNELCVL